MLIKELSPPFAPRQGYGSGVCKFSWLGLSINPDARQVRGEQTPLLASSRAIVSRAALRTRYEQVHRSLHQLDSAPRFDAHGHFRCRRGVRHDMGFFHTRHGLGQPTTAQSSGVYHLHARRGAGYVARPVLLRALSCHSMLASASVARAPSVLPSLCAITP
jgi:hypothetical protein